MLAVYSPLRRTHCDLRVQRDDSVPPALVALSRQRDETHVLREVSPRKLTHFLVWPEQASIGEQAAQPEVLIELANLIEDRLNILERACAALVSLSLSQWGLLDSAAPKA